jgi:hypothetical protein
MVNHDGRRVKPAAESYNASAFAVSRQNSGAEPSDLSGTAPMDMLIGFVIGAVVALLLVAVVAFARAGSLGRAWWGLGVAGRAGYDPAFAARVHEAMTATPTPAVPPPPPKPSGAPVRMLAILQTEARLIDFLLEDISPYPDAQIGQAVREIHRKSQAALRQHLELEPILAGAEGDTVTVPKGFDPSAIRVLGNVTGEPPFTGQVQHPGWRVRELKLPPLPAGQDEFVIQPAEVHLP